MERALVVVDDTDAHRELLREAGELAAGVDAELVLLTTMTEEEYEEDWKALETIADVENTGYSEENILEVAEEFASDTAEDVLDGVGVRYEAVGRLAEPDDHAQEILAVAESEGCDHVFVTGRRRSPTGKAIFGDTAQKVILNFDGRVTVQTA